MFPQVIDFREESEALYQLMQPLGAEAFGMACYWSNRTGDIVPDPAYPARYTGPNLTGLLDIL